MRNRKYQITIKGYAKRVKSSWVPQKKTLQIGPGVFYRVHELDTGLFYRVRVHEETIELGYSWRLDKKSSENSAFF